MKCDLSISQSSVGAPCTIPVNVANAVLQPCMGHTGTTLNDGLTCYTQCEMDYVPCPSQLFCRQGGGACPDTYLCLDWRAPGNSDTLDTPKN